MRYRTRKPPPLPDYSSDADLIAISRDFRANTSEPVIRDKLSTSNFYGIFERFIAHVRKCQISPLIWYRSQGFEMNKGAGNKPDIVDNWRLLHLMDPWGKLWHSTLLAERRGIDVTHAYLPHRSRIEPIMTVSILSHRLRRAGTSHLRNHFDVKNAFPSVAQPSILAFAAVIVALAMGEVAAKHCIVLTVVVISTYTGAVCLLLQQGTLPGHPFAVECFRRVFTHIVIRWQELRHRSDQRIRLLVTRCPGGSKVDTSATNYSDFHESNRRFHGSINV